MTSLYQKAVDAWKSYLATLPEGTQPWEVPAHLAAEGEAGPRAADKALGEAMQEPIQMYQDGLISATEFVDKIVFAAHAPVPERTPEQAFEEWMASTDKTMTRVEG